MEGGKLSQAIEFCLDQDLGNILKSLMQEILLLFVKGKRQADVYSCFYSFISYRTGHYKLHYYETPTSLKFVMVTDTRTNNLRIVLHQIYVGLYVEYGRCTSLSQAASSCANNGKWSMTRWLCYWLQYLGLANLLSAL